MIILFMACCDAPLPNRISHIQMKDNVVYVNKCPNDVQYSKMIEIQLGPKALANLVPAI